MTAGRRLAVAWMAAVVALSAAPLAAVGTSGTDGAAGGNAALGSPPSFAVEQAGRCVPATPLRNGSEDVVSFYDYRNPSTTPSASDFSSYMPDRLTENQTSRLFLYEDPDGNVSLVVVHNERDGGTGGESAATFRFAGLPDGGEWVVEDDEYVGRDDSFARTEIDWIWASDQRTDGGAFRGLDGDTALTIDPAFDEEADLYDTFGLTGDLAAWQVVSGTVADPVVVDLASMRANVTVRAGTCPGDGKPSASLSASPPTVDAGEAVTLDAGGSTDDNAVIRYRWDLDGDGSADRTTGQPTVTASYSSAGDHTATVTVVDTGGQTASASATVTVESDGTAPTITDYGVAKPNGSDTVFVAFDSSERLADVTVEVTDASGSTVETLAEGVFPPVERNGTVVYRSDGIALPDGTYTATLVTAADAAGNDGATGQSGTVTVHTPPTARVDAPATVGVGETFALSGSRSRDSGILGIESYEWTLGDGSTASGEQVRHSYDAPGSYTVTLTVTDPAGNTDTATATVEVRPRDGDGPDDSSPPTASFTAPSTVDVGEGLSVDGSGSSDDTGVSSYRWKFGDGTTATGPTAAHTYSEAGSYTITLTVTDPAGNTDTATRTVTVRPVEPDEPPTAALAGPSEPVTLGEKFVLDASASTDDRGVVQYLWDYTGDGHADRVTDDPVITTFVDSRPAIDVRSDDPDLVGTFTVTVWAVDAAGQRDTATATVTLAESDGGDDGDGGDGGDADDGDGSDPGDGDGSDPGDGGDAGDGGDDGDGRSPGDGTDPDDAGDVGGPGGSAGGSGGADGATGFSVDVSRPDAGLVVARVTDAPAGGVVTLALPALDDGSAVRFGDLDVNLARGNDFRLEARTTATPPGAVREPEPGADGFEALSYLSVRHADLEGWALANATFTFEVRGERLAAMNASPDAVTAYRLSDGGWRALETTWLGRPANASADAPANATAFAADPNATYRFAAHSPWLSTFAVGVDRPVIAVTRLSVDGTGVTAGDRVEFEVTVENRGRANGTDAVEAVADGETVASRTVAVARGESRTVTLTWRPEAAGDYTVMVGDAVVDLSVEGATTTTATTTAPTTATATATTTEAGGDGDDGQDAGGDRAQASGDRATRSGGQPGFGTAVALLALVAAAVLALRRRR